MEKRFLKALSYMIPASMIGFLVMMYVNEWFGKTLITHALLLLSDFFCLQNYGFYVVSATGVVWYLSALFFAVWLIEPLLYKYYEVVKYVSFIIAVFLYGRVIENVGSLEAPRTSLLGWIDSGFCRAVAGILNGITLNTLTERWKGHELSALKKLVLTIIEVMCYTCVVVYMFQWDDDYQVLDGSVLIIMSFGLLITFSGYSLFYQKFDKDVILRFAKLTMPIFLVHFQIVQNMTSILEKLNISTSFWQVKAYIFVFIAAVIVLRTGEFINLCFMRLKRN